MGHTLLCVLSLFLLNTLFYGKAEEPEPKASLTADKTVIPAGGSVTLTCSVDGSDDWKYYGFRRDSHSAADPVRDVRAHGVMVVTEGGFYHCIGGRGDPEFFTQNSEEVHIQKTVYSRVTVTLQPSSSLIYSGEKITVRCEIQGGGDTGWTYEWRTTSSNNPPSHSEYTISRAAESHSGDYSCRGRRDYSLTEWSQVMRLTVSRSKPTATLTADRTVLPAGGRVTLTCSVDRSYSWKYDWFRRTSVSSEAETVGDTDQPNTVITQGGVYTCRGRRGQPEFFTQESSKVTIKETVSSRVTVTLQPNWSQIYSGEKITVSCEIQGGDTGWTYEWKTNSSFKPSNQHEYRISSASSSHSGDYMCRGRMKSAQHNITKWSDSVKLTVYDKKPRPVLTVSPSWLSPGASVTLKCEVELPSAGWRFYWYKAVPDGSQRSYRYELLPGSSSGTEQDSYIVLGQTHTAGYVCKAGRGDPVIYTETSELKFVWSGDVRPSASLTVSPDRVQHFTSDSVSLSCEGNSTEWRVRRFDESKYLSHCSDFGIITGSTCNIYSYGPSNAVYWCESGSGEFSNTVNITLQNYYTHGIILLSPVRPVTEGESVTLGCKLRTEQHLSSVFFYQNDKLIQNDSRVELNISAVSQSDEGFYKCQSSGRVSAQSWMSVKAVPRPESSSFPVLLIVGPVCGIVLIVLLLLFFRYRNSTGGCDGAEESSDYVNVNPDSAKGP
ncbi:Fc receptor-like protein 5 [Seriola aureovittata]|uniref:Fc receptor-like protein 5 n=1 Tax=Seriola aureovittata TaxID=2871759 RepID=UPI0024BDB386|nr:Fc receptor-like protein 5 [Seriola aureovittata]